MLQPVEFNQAVNYVNKIRVSRFHMCAFVYVSIPSPTRLIILFGILLESISKPAGHIQIFFGNPSHLPEGTENY